MKLQALALATLLALSPAAVSESVLPDGYDEAAQLQDLILADQALERACTFVCASNNAQFGGKALLDMVTKSIQCACNRSQQPDKEATIK